MPGRHEAPPLTFDATVSDYVTGRARELIRQVDAWNAGDEPLDNKDRWIGATAEILRELTRDA